jgi:pimeloyl-ACP methyl ester carboxylesterase
MSLPVAVRRGDDRAMTPDTIVLVHGFWMTPRSWESWVPYLEGKGYRVIAPGYPGFEPEVEALNADPQVIADLTAPAVLDHLESVIAAVETPPILIGHSAGGAFVQVMLDRGYGAAGVAINSAPTEGVAVAPLTQLRSTFPVLKNPANRHRAVGLTFEQFHYAFTNTIEESRARELYERYAIPASGRILWNGVLANLMPGPQDIAVDYHKEDRAPLLFISGSEDHIMPPKVQESNLKHYKTGTVERREFEGRPHLMVADEGWEEIADLAVSWAASQAVPAPA